MKRKVYKLLAFAMAVFMVVGLLPATRIAGTEAKAAGEITLGTPIKADSASSFTFPDVNVPSGTYYGMSISVSGGTMDTTGASSKNVAGNFATWNWSGGQNQTYAAAAIAAIKFSVPVSMTVTVTLNKGGTTNLSGATAITEGTGSFAGHYYLYVRQANITWHQAYNNAKSFTYNGMRGYLATITTAAEHAFLAAISSSENAWTSGTSLVKVAGNAKINDDTSITANTGVLKFPDNYPNSNDTAGLKPLFYWACGPEAGDSLTSAPWTGGEPNKGYINSPNFTTSMDVLGIADGETMYESCVQANYGGGLNDYAECSIAGTNLPTYIKGYFVEFGGYSSRGKIDPGGANAGQSISGSASVSTSDIKTKVSFAGDHYGLDLDTALSGGWSNAAPTSDFKGAVLSEATSTLTLKANNGYYFDEEALQALLLGKPGVSGKVNADGTVTLTFTNSLFAGGSLDLSNAVKVCEARNGSKNYGKLSDALNESSSGTIEVLSSSASATGTLKDGVTLQDNASRTFTADGDANVTVESGVLTGLNSGKGDYSGSGSVTVDGKPVGTDSGKTVTLNADEKTATPKENNQNVTIDGVTFNSPESMPEYDLGDPYKGLEVGGTANVPSGKTLKTDGDNANLTVTGEAEVTKTAPDGTGKVGQATVGNDKTAKVGENSYKGTDNTVLDLVKDGEGAGHVELAEGSVTLPAADGDHNNAVTVNGKVVENTNGKDITVSKDSDNIVVDAGAEGGKVKVGDRDYVIPGGPTKLVVKPDGESETDNYYLEQGKAELDKDEDIIVHVGEGETAEDVKVENKSEGDAKLTVDADSPDNGATVTVPAGGKMQTGDDVYSNKGEEPVKVELRPDGSKAVTSGDVTLEDGEIVIPGDNKDAKVTVPGTSNVDVQNEGSEDLTITCDQPTPGKTVVDIPEGGKAKIGENSYEGPAKYVIDSEGNVSKLVYAVNGETFDKLDDALTAAEKVPAEGDSTIVVYGTPIEAEKATVTGEQTFVDYYGRTYTVPAGATAELTVETDGTITVKSGKVEFDPGEAENKSVNIEHNNENPDGPDHVVTPQGKVTIEAGDEKCTVTPDDPETAVDIDGVVYQAPAGADAPAYDLDKPFDALPENGTATMPKDKEVAVSGTEPEGGFTVKTDAENSGDTVITKGGEDDVAGQVEVPAGDTVTVNDNKYTAKSGEDGAKLDLVKDAENGDHAQLVEGEITLPADATEHDNSVYVAGEKVTNPNEGQDITVKAGEPTADGKPTGTVTVPEKGKSVQIGEEEYTNAGSDDLVIEINDDGNTLTGGTLTLPGNEEGQPDASILVKAGEGENEKNIPVTNKGGEGSDVTVNGSDEAADGKPTVTVPGGGAVAIGEGETATEYSVPEGEGNTKFVIGEDGKPDITSGAVDLDDDESVGFGSVEIGCKGTDPDGDTKDAVKVEVQEDGSSAKVTVPAGETLTVTDADGNEHTYTNNGDSELTFTVDPDGNVTVDEIPEKGLDLGPNSPITITDKGGANPNTLTAGAEGATLKPSGEGTTSNPPLLEKGSVIFPDGSDGTKGSVVVKDPTAKTNENKTLEGTDVEVFAGDSEENPVKVQAKSEDAKVQVQGGTEYIFPEGEDGDPAPMDNGTLLDPAKGKINDGKDGPEDGKYVLVPDGNNGTGDKGTLWTDGAAESGKNETHVLGDNGAAFDMRVKQDGHTGKDEEDLQEGSLGHYEVTKPDSHFTVDNSTGEVTLEDGGLHVKKGEPAFGEGNPSVTLKGIAEDESGKGLEVSGEEVTVTMTDDGGADVTVPGGKSVKIGEDEYTAAEGESGLTLHVDENGNVSLKDGSIVLDDNESIPFGDIVFENPADSGSDQVTVTAPMKDVEGYGDGSAKVVVPAAGDSGSNSVVVGKDTDTDTKTYTNEGSEPLELEVTPNGDVKLHGGEVTLPADTPVTAGDTEVESETPGTKVETEDGETFSVTVPGSETEPKNEVTLTVPGEEGQPDKELKYTNPSDTEDMVIEVPVQENGYPTLTDGSAELDPAQGGNPGEGLNVKTGTNSTPVENTGDETITVHAKGEGDSENASVDIPSGGSAKIGDNSVEASGDDITVELDDEGGIKVKPGEGNEVTVIGKTYRPKPESPDAELSVDKNGKVTDGRDDFTVIVDPNAGLVHIEDGETVTITDGENEIQVTGGPAWINVKNGEVEAVTVKKDEEGNEIEEIDEVVGHFSNAGDGPLQLTIKEDGDSDNPTPETTLTGGTVEAGPDSVITVDGKTYTPGSSGATLTYGTQENGGPTLEQGSVILPQDEPFGENNASVKVKNGENTTTYTGQNVEVSAGTAGVKGVDNTEAEDGRDGGTVTVTGSTSPENKHDYFVPSDEGNAAITSGTDNQLDPPAMEKVNGNRAGESSQKYVVVPDSANGAEKNIYVDRNGTNDSNTAMNLDNGAAFDVKPKDKGEVTGTVEEPAGDSIGHYAAASDNTKATVNHETGEVTLTEGTLKFSGNGKDSESGAQLLIPGANGENHSIVSDGTHEVTVTAGTALDGGAGTGADISVPAGGSVTINGKTYTANGEGGLELWMDAQGNVYLKDGVVELSDGADILFEHTKFTNPGDPASDTVTVTAYKGTEGGEDTPATEPYAELEVSNGGSVSVQQGGKDVTYKNAGSDSLTLHSDGKGNVSLQSGSVELPTDGSLGYTAGSKGNTRDFTVESKDGLTVETGEGENKAQVTVPENQTLSVKFEDKSGAEKSGAYTPAEGSDEITVELTADGPMLAEGKVNLEKGSALGAGGALFENTGSGSVAVDASDSGSPTVTIPENGSAKVNGVEVKGASMGNEPESMTGTVDESDGSVSFSLGKDEKLTVDGVTYVGGEGGCTITMDKDGKVSVDGSVSRTVTLGEASGDITLNDGESLTILDKNGNTLTTVTDKEGDDKNSTLSVDEKGNITMKSGDVTVKGTAKTEAYEWEEDEPGKPSEDPKWTYVGEPDITVKSSESGAPVSGAKVTIKDKDGEEVATGTTGDDGKVTKWTPDLTDVEYGPYTVEVVIDGVSSTTGSLNVNAPTASVEFKAETVAIDTKMDSDLSSKGNEPTVSGPDGVLSNAEKQQAAIPDSGSGSTTKTEIDITLYAKELGVDSSIEMTADEASRIQGVINEAAGIDESPTASNTKEISDWIDVTVTKQVTEYTSTGSGWDGGTTSDPEAIPTTASLIELRFPISSDMNEKLKDLTNGTVDTISIEEAYNHIFIYRQHKQGDKETVEQMRRVTPEYGPRATMECYYIEVTEGSEGTAYIVIRARNFSVYAFGVSKTEVKAYNPSSGGVSGGAYEVNVPELKYGGTVTADRGTAAPGTRVTLTVTPDADCTVDSVVVTDAQGNALAVTDNGDGTYSFNMPASDVDVQVIFSANCPKDATCPIDQYTDASPKAWYHDGVHFVLQNGIMKGYGNYIFLPDAGLTRAMVAQMLYNMMDNPAVSGASTFVDVEPGTWYADAIAWAQREDVVRGYTDTVFGPEDLITREQLVTILYRYEEKFGELKEVPADYVLAFSDAADTSPWAEDAMRWAALTGLVKGYGGSEKLVPGGRASRAESAEIFKRWLAPNLKY